MKLKSIREEVRGAKRALAGDSNDAEHEALVTLLEALGVPDKPECACGEDEHNRDCPVSAWRDS